MKLIRNEEELGVFYKEVYDNPDDIISTLEDSLRAAWAERDRYKEALKCYRNIAVILEKTTATSRNVISSNIAADALSDSPE